MTYYHRSKPAALEAGQSRFGADWYVDSQFEPDNGWVIVIRPRDGYTTLKNSDIPDILQYAEIQATLRMKHDKVRYTPPTPSPRVRGGEPGSVGGGSVTLRLKAIWESVGVTNREQRQAFVEAAIAEGINRNSAGAFWAKYAREKGI